MSSSAWLYWAWASAFFAALTAIFAKIGLQGIDSDFATFIRTLVIVVALATFLTYTGKWQKIDGFSGKNWLFLCFPAWQQGHRGWRISRLCRWGMPRKWLRSTNSAWCWWL